MSAAGFALVFVGTLVIFQVLGGHALMRLGVIT